MEILRSVPQHEAYYVVQNMIKKYRTRDKLYEFKKRVEKKHSNFEETEQSKKLRVRNRYPGTDKLTEVNRVKNQVRSMRRSKTNIEDFIEENDFELFGTFTFSPKEVDRYDDHEVKKKLVKWLSNMKRKANFEYLIIPERHKRCEECTEKREMACPHDDRPKALHFHGLLRGIPEEWLADSGKRDKGGRQIFNLKPYYLGFSNFSRIVNLEATSKYCAKYIQKDLNVMGKGKRRYWRSDGLKKPEKAYNVDKAAYVNNDQQPNHETIDYALYVVPHS